MYDFVVGFICFTLLSVGFIASLLVWAFFVALLVVAIQAVVQRRVMRDGKPDSEPTDTVL